MTVYGAGIQLSISRPAAAQLQANSLGRAGSGTPTTVSEINGRISQLSAGEKFEGDRYAQDPEAAATVPAGTTVGGATPDDTCTLTVASGQRCDPILVGTWQIVATKQTQAGVRLLLARPS